MSNFTKSDLVEDVVAIVGLSKKDASAAVEAVLSFIQQKTADGHAVAIREFGKFSMKERAARTGRNPATGAAIEIAASRVLSFKPSKSST